MYKNLIKVTCLFILVLYQRCYGLPTTGIPDESTYDINSKTEADINMDAARSISDQQGRTSISHTSDEPQGLPNLEKDIEGLLDIILHLENLITQSNISNDEGMRGAAKKVVTKVKEGFNKVKNKVKGGYDKVKDKVKVGIDKIKDKIGKIKDNVGTGVGGRDGYGIKDNYHRRPYGKRTSADYSGGGGIDPTFLWVFLGLGIAGILGTILYFMIKK